MGLDISKTVRKYHYLMWRSICLLGLLLEVPAGALGANSMPVTATTLPEAEAVRSYLKKSQLPAHLKDVLENRLATGPFLRADADFQFPGHDLPVDWHLEAKTRRVLAHVDFGNGSFTFYPGFYSLSVPERVELIIHMGLHQMPGLGVSRLSEPTVRQFADMLAEDQKVSDFDERKKMRERIRLFLDQRWAVGKSGSVFLASGENYTLLRPWPFDVKKREAKLGK